MENNGDKKNLLVTLADRNYIKQAKQLFSSVYWNAGWKGDYMLLAHEIPEKELKWFRDKGILVRKCKPLYNSYLGAGPYKYPPVVLDKFYLFTPEFRKWKNIIFLDADIIVRASLDELTKVKGLATSSPLGQKFKFHFFSDLKDDKEMRVLRENYNLNKSPLNSAMMFFSTDIIKKEILEKMMTLFKKYRKIALGDDPIINLFFYKKWINFPPVYNVLIDYTKNHPKKAIIFHFGGVKELNKPWNPKSIFYHEWKNNLDKAELIDLDHIPGGKKWTKFEINIYSLYLKIRSYIFLISRQIFIYLSNTPDRLIGKIGILIRRINPNLYHKLKKIKDGK